MDLEEENESLDEEDEENVEEFPLSDEELSEVEDLIELDENDEIVVSSLRVN